VTHKTCNRKNYASVGELYLMGSVQFSEDHFCMLVNRSTFHESERKRTIILVCSEWLWHLNYWIICSHIYFSTGLIFNQCEFKVSTAPRYREI